MADSSSNNLELWVEEKHRDIVGLRYRVKSTLFSERSPYQQVDIVETVGMGKMLLNDGLVMLSEKDEHIYHEMIAHVPLFTNPSIEKVLVVGGGDGGTVREVIRHSQIKECVLVEIDELVVEACKQHIPQTAACLDNPKVELVIQDAVKFVAETDRKFDLILVDSSDPIGPACPLFGEDFYHDLSNKLTDNGIVVSQAGSPFYETQTQTSLLGILKEIFPVVGIYNYSNITYPGGLWSFSFASKGPDPLADFDPKLVEQSELDFAYYTAAIHRSSFCLPQTMRNSLSEFITKHFI